MKGLENKEVLKLREKFGKNRIAIKEISPLWLLLFNQYTNTVSLILLSAGIFAFYIREIPDSIFIFSVLFANGLFGFFQEYKAEKTLQKLQSFVVETSRVVRDGQEQAIDSKDLVPGDLVVLEEGKKVPADGVFMTDICLSVDESILTGESMPIEKNKGDLLLSGTYIFRGKGVFRVEKTGFATQLGKIAQEMSRIKKPRTPLALGLDALGKKMTLIAFGLSLVLVFIGIGQGREIKEMILITVSLAVAVIPEGLPLIVSMALAVGAYRMARERTVVKKMSSIETLGGANLILTDKTGTLTQNKMVVKKYLLAKNEKPERLFLACSLGNGATLVAKEDGKSGWAVLGDGTDGALALFVEEKLGNYENLKNTGKILLEKPFDSLTKTVEVVWRKSPEEGFIFIKGAPEKVITYLQNQDRQSFQKEFETLAAEGLRVIAFVYRKIPPNFSLASLKNGYHNFNFLGITGIYDPPRPEAKETIQKAKNAGVRVVIATGDNPKTAQQIAETVGLIEENELVLTSSEIQEMTDQALLAILPKVRIFARFSPEDKLRIVRLFKQKGYVVSVIGDGVNDALALKEANVGIAMGESGTDVTKEAADMVITDDNLLTVVEAILEGRSIFNNILRSVFYLISANIAEFAVIFFSLIFYLPAPLLPAQILWINLVTDGVPALALVTDSNRKKLLFSKPRKIQEGLFNQEKVIYTLKIALAIIFIMLLVFFLSAKFLDIRQARFLVFNSFVVLELFFIFVVRGGIFPLNKFLIISVLFSLLLQFAIIYFPFLRNIFF